MTASAWRGSCPVTDAHHHLWDLSVRPQPFLDSDAAFAPLRRPYLLSDLAPQAAAAGVISTVVVQTVTAPGETTDLLALAAASPLIGAVVGWTDLTAPDVADEIARLRAAPGGQYLTGLRHPLLTEPDPDWLSLPAVRRGLAAVAAAGLTFDLVLQPGQLPAATAAAERLPELTFVLDHLGNPDVTADGPLDPVWNSTFPSFAAVSGTVGKLSGLAVDAAAGDRDGQLARLRRYAGVAIEAFGPERLMFGSDWPMSTLAAPYPEVVGTGRELVAGLSEPEQAAILTGTAHRVYGTMAP